MAEFPAAEELEALFREGKMERIGMGSRRACYKIPGTELCVKCYRSDDEIEEGLYNGSKKLSSSVVREIKQARFDEKRNTCCQEYRYWVKLRKKLPTEFFAAFPQTMECVLVPSRGWCILEERIINANGTEPECFAHAFRKADSRKKAQLLHSLKRLLKGLISNSVRLYDPQNIVVQSLQGGKFKLRLMDFEPSGRCLIPIDALLPAFVRMKSFRRARRWMRAHLGVKVGSWIRFFKSQSVIEKWDGIIATEGAAMGLSECSVFLENKMVKDIFYEGLFKGVSCVVKCSSRAPESIRNEYEVGVKLNVFNPQVFPRFYGCHVSEDGKYAFVAMEKLHNLKEIEPKSAGEDVVGIIKALDRTGIVHRDVYIDNLMIGDDGHLKLIDFQFAVDRNNYEECAWMRRNWKYRYVVLGIVSGLSIGVWNDASGMMKTVSQICDYEESDRVCAIIKKYESRLEFAPKIPFIDKFRLRIYEIRLKVQNFFVFDKQKKDARRRRLLRLLNGRCA